MKMIIDIPFEVYEAHRKGIQSMENDCIISNAVYDAVPYEGTGDLISRNEVKKELIARIEYLHDPEDIKAHVKECLDTAHIVDAYSFAQVRELFNLNKEFADEIDKLKRPQGEWKFLSSYTNSGIWKYECPLCKRTVDAKGNEKVEEKYPFCHCGADMRGGAK